MVRAARDNVYLSAMFGRQQEMRGYREDLVGAGFHVTSTWLDASASVSEADLSIEDRSDIAIANLDDLYEADIVVAFTEDPQTTKPFASRGGRHVEVGYALGMDKGIVVVGPRENVFHCILGIQAFDTWAEALEYLKRR